MFRFHICIALLATGLFCGILNCGALALAEDFRVDNAVFAGAQKEPSSQSVTIFHDGIVYDIMIAPAEAVVFDKPAGKFILLNMTNQTRAELATSDVASVVNRLQGRAPANADPVAKFLADPKFQERFDEAAGELTLGSALVTYRLVLSTGESQAAVDQYREFSDWYARLNSLLSPGSRPPFGRLAVNAAVAKRKAIATQVILATASSKAGGQPTTIRSTHRIVHTLTQAQLDNLAKIRKAASEFKLVSFEKYRKGEM